MFPLSTSFDLLLVSDMFPLSTSFDLLRPDYIESLGFNASLIPGFVSTTMDPFLQSLTMTFCRSSREIQCEPQPDVRPVCKIPCESGNCAITTGSLSLLSALGLSAKQNVRPEIPRKSS